MVGYLKELVKIRKDIKIILMSATVDEKLFRQYFTNAGGNFDSIMISTKSNFPI